MNMNELRSKAKEAGINSHGKTKEELESLLGNSGVRRTSEDAAERARQIREKRRSEGFDPLAANFKLHTRGQKPGWKYAWPLNKENRIYQMQQKGYQIDESVEHVSAGDNSNGQKHIRMMIPQDIYDEDFALKMARIDGREQDMRRADVKGGLQEVDGAYGDITIGQKTVKLGSTQG